MPLPKAETKDIITHDLDVTAPPQFSEASPLLERRLFPRPQKGFNHDSDVTATLTRNPLNPLLADMYDSRHNYIDFVHCHVNVSCLVFKTSNR